MFRLNMLFISAIRNFYARHARALPHERYNTKGGSDFMIKKLLSLNLLLLCVLVAVPGSVFSQEEKGQTGVYTMGEVVVTAERDGVESIATVREITQEDIRNQGARTLDEALTLLPGLNIRVGAQGVPRVDMRGLRARHIILLVDGIPFNSTYDGQFDPSIIGLENIAKIKVSYGNHSVLYGDGGLGGVINIITKKGSKGVHGMVAGEVGDRSSYLGTVNVSGAGEIVDFFVSGSASTTDGFPLSDDFNATSEENGSLRENSDKDRSNLFANLGVAPTENLQIGFIANALHSEYGIPPSTINDNSNLFASSPKYERVEDLDGYSAQLSVNYNVTKSFELRSWAFLNQLDEEKKQYDNNQYNSMDDVSVKTYEENNTTNIQGVNLQAKYDFASAGFATLGLSAREEKWESDGRIRDVRIARNVYDFRTFDNERSNDVYTAALEYTVSPVDDLGLVAGYSHNWLSKDGGDHDDEGSYLAGAYYDILDGTRLRGSYARKIRFPTVSQLYDETAGNPDLKTEKSDNYELGVIQRLPGNSSIEVTGFSMDVKNYIEKDSTNINQNRDNYLFQGIEVTAETRAIERLMLRLGYTWMDTKDKSEGTEVTDLQYRPRHKVTAESMYGFDFGLSAYLNVMYVAGQSTYSKNDPVIKADFNDYTLVNVKISQALLDRMVTLYVGVDNILDEDYEESYGFPQAGRYVYGGVEVRF